MSTVDTPSYGASDHYLEGKGEEYFRWQSGGADFAARINAHKFRHIVKDSDTVLDFGCGGGFLLNELSCARRIGVEINPVAREHARRLGIECYPNASEVPDDVADVILSDHALEHVPYPIGALRELRSKLKQDGLLVIRVPIDNWRHQRRYDANDQNHHLHTWTSQNLGNSLMEAGFEVVDIAIHSYCWPGRWTVACYGRLPLSVFNFICWSYCIISGRGRQLFATARPRADVRNCCIPADSQSECYRHSPLPRTALLP